MSRKGKIINWNENSAHGKCTKSKRAGRPKLQLCEQDVLRLAQTGLTDREIAHILDVSLSTIENFRDVIRRGRSQLSQSLKRKQLQLALHEGDRNMLIWLGKQYAGQREAKHVEHSGHVSQPQVILYADDVESWNAGARTGEGALEVEAEESGDTKDS